MTCKIYDDCRISSVQIKTKKAKARGLRGTRAYKKVLCQQSSSRKDRTFFFFAFSRINRSSLQERWLCTSARVDCLVSLVKTPLTRSTCKKGWPWRPAGKLHKPRKCGVTLIGKINSQVAILGIIFFKSDLDMTKKKIFLPRWLGRFGSRWSPGQGSSCSRRLEIKINWSKI